MLRRIREFFCGYERLIRNDEDGPLCIYAWEFAQRKEPVHLVRPTITPSAGKKSGRLGTATVLRRKWMAYRGSPEA